jgi:endonuclease/exonuclease/phosphatase family metal-dependent hydrolase
MRIDESTGGWESPSLPLSSYAAEPKIEESTDGWDRPFLKLSSYAAEPLCQVFGLLRYRLVAPLEPGKFGNAQSKIVEVATRVFIAATAAFLLIAHTVPTLSIALALGAASKLFRMIGFAFQKNGYTHIRGDAPEKTLPGQAKILTWNLCGIGGGMHLDHGGVNSWRERLDGIVTQILSDDHDVLELQEIYDTAFAEALIDKLKGHYAHFFAHLGANVWGSVGGGMVLSKCAVSRFTNTSFANNDWTLNRTFATLDIKASPDAPQAAARLIGTHFIHGKDNAKRLAQLDQVKGAVARETLALPTVLMGDLNLEKDKPEEGGRLDLDFIHAYPGTEPTCTNEFVRQWEGKATAKPPETIDYISLFRAQLGLPVIEQGIAMRNTHLLRAFGTRQEETLSDHHGIVTTLIWA